MQKRFFLTVWCCCLLTCSFAQVQMNRDSLLHLLPLAGKDIAAVELFINLGQQYENTEPESAKAYYLKAGNLSREINYPAGIIKYISNYSAVLNMQGRFDSSLQLNLEAVDIAKKQRDTLNIAKTLINTGNAYQNLKQFEEAIKCYEEGKQVLSTSGNQETEAQLEDILQNLYFGMGQYEKAISHGTRAVSYFRKTNNIPWLAYSLNNLAVTHIRKNDLSTALGLLDESMTLAEKMGDLNTKATLLINIADIYLKQGNYQKMQPFYEEALLLNRQIGSQEGIAIALRGLSYHAISQKQYPRAIQFAKESLQIAEKNRFLTEQHKSLSAISNIYYAMQDMRKAEEFNSRAVVIADSILNEKVLKNTIEIEKQYETEQKELLIRGLEADKELQLLSIRQKRMWNYLLAGGCLVLLVFSLLAYRNYRQKQNLQLRRIQELETEKQLAATEAVLKGEEQERSRLAKDLHDGLGGMLSGIKYSMNMMKGNLVMTPENVQAFERSMDMLDSSIREMRRVAHNLMPEALVKFGLDAALKDFCNDINQSGAISVTYQSFGLERAEPDQTISITVFRIVQELIHNTMKHAGARQAIVQLTRSEGFLTITVEDDGKGFDPAQLKNSGGIGWSNIRNRVEFMKGNLDIRSAPGKGSSILIEIPVS